MALCRRGELAVICGDRGDRSAVQQRRGEVQGVHRPESRAQLEGMIDHVVVHRVEVDPAHDLLDIGMRPSAGIHRRMQLDLQQAGGEQPDSPVNSASTAETSGSRLSSVYAAEVCR